MDFTAVDRRKLYKKSSLEVKLSVGGCSVDEASSAARCHVISVQQGTWFLTRVQGVLIRAACSHIIQELNGSHVIPVQQGPWVLARVHGVLIRAACSQT
jgi:hypothetical protein